MTVLLLNCTVLFDLFNFDPRYIAIYKYCGSILFILGVLGNTLGFIVATRVNKYHVKMLFKKLIPNSVMTFNGVSAQGQVPVIALSESSLYHSPNSKDEIGIRKRLQAQNLSIQGYKIRRLTNINQYLLKWFFVVNLFNVFRALGVRLLEIFEIGRVIKIYIDPRKNRSISSSWIDDFGWTFYTSKIHFPSTNPFIILGFMIYVLFFLSQMIAINFPFSYKRIFTLRNVRIMIVICFVYGFIWYIPTFNWSEMITIPICPYKSNDYLFHSLDGNHTYFHKSQFSANLSNPIIFHTQVIKRVRKPILKELWVAYQVCRELFTKIFPFIAIIILKTMILRKAHTVRPRNVNRTSRSEGSGFRDSSRYQRRILKERKQHLKTIFILSIEFVVLLLPISISQAMMDLLIRRLTSRDILIWHTILNMLEFFYISCTFFINFAFNDIYRHYAIQRCRSIFL
ncbi:unnamed protein product [Gordionus sp. m RMFG-2023]